MLLAAELHTKGPGVEHPAKGNSLLAIVYKLLFPLIPNVQ